MIYNALLAPKEHPPSLLEVKRALLSFDKVLLVSPDDRELFPPSFWMSVTTGLPAFVGIPFGWVRPLGKVPGYDDAFSQIADQLRGPIQQGRVEVVSTYNVGET